MRSARPREIAELERMWQMAEMQHEDKNELEAGALLKVFVWLSVCIACGFAWWTAIVFAARLLQWFGVRITGVFQ
jgi:hypothetical protein